MAIHLLVGRLQQWGHFQEGTNNSLIAIGLGLTVLAIIGQVDGNLRTSINNNLPEVAPSYFVVDIQKSQIEEVRDILNSNKGVISFDEAPMLRGIITKINNKQASEVAGDHWVIRGDRGITYFEELPKDSILQRSAMAQRLFGCNPNKFCC